MPAAQRGLLMTATLCEIAKVLGGEVRGAQVLAPGPVHGRNERSVSIKLIPGDSFIVPSFAGDEPIACRDYVRAALGLGLFRPPLSGTLWIAVDNDHTRRRRAAELAERWAAAGHKVFTIVPNAIGADLDDLARRQQ
jgi:hypothetical protein